jgi:DNA mismatch repair protein MutL
MRGPVVRPAARPIRRLAPETVERIAAGEVVERPASVVKELVENALDAGATEVRVHLVGGGLERLRVDDDGGGIAAGDLRLAVERHATSKLESSAELERIETLGFRGEALASIAAVSRLTITSRPAGSDAAHQLVVTGGTVEREALLGRPPGTTVEVRDLFFNTPARRKFLRSPAAEQLETLSLLERMYLARPDVGLTVAAEAGELGRYPPVGRLGDATARVFGPEFLSRSFEVDADLPGGGRLRAVLGRPTVHRSTSRSLSLAVNGRAIVARPLAQAVRAAYIDYLPRTRFPVGALSLTLDPRRVDVNVHPTKREVRFADERDLVDAVRRAVREAILRQPQVAESPAPSMPRVPARAPRAPLSPPAPPRPVAGTARQRSLGEPPAPVDVAASARHPGLRLLGSLFAVYWAAEADGALYVIDQHAASERVLFDALRRDGRLGRQELLQPAMLPLGPTARAALTVHAEEVARAGFVIEPFGGDRVRVAAVPSYLGRRMAVDQLPALLDELAAGGRPTVPDGLVDRVAASIACHAAVRGGDVIDAEEMRRILDRLYALAAPAYACPHGRPILVEVPRARLDRWFLRRGA